MALLNLTPDELLTTTRAVRKRLDFSRPVPMDLIRECLEIALQAPTGGNTQGWHFIVITDAAKRAKLAEIYRKAWAWYETTLPKSYPTESVAKGPTQRIQDSAAYLAQHLHEVPVHLVGCLEGRPAIDGPIPPFSRGRFFVSSGLEFHAGGPHAGTGHGLDHAPYPPRKRSR